MMQLKKMFLDSSAEGRPGKKIKPKGLVIHWTANTNPGSDADNNRNYFNNSGVAASAHYVVDDHQVVQCLPEDEMGYHVGAKKYSSKALQGLSDYPNDCTIGIEICVNEDGNFDETWKNAVALSADICRRHGWTGYDLWRHYDITGKDCPRFFVDDKTAAAFGFKSALSGWHQVVSQVERALTKEEKQQVPQWKQQILERAKKEGLISDEHHPDEQAPKWFVLAVALNLLDKINSN